MDDKLINGYINNLAQKVQELQMEMQNDSSDVRMH